VGVGVGASGVSPLLELSLELGFELELLSELELLLGASPGMSGAASVGNGCAVEAEGFGALAAGAAGALVSPGNGNCCAGAAAAGGCVAGAAVQGFAAGWSAGHGAVVVCARQAAAEKALAANKIRIEVHAGII
jgi:hypothetical protein